MTRLSFWLLLFAAPRAVRAQDSSPPREYRHLVLGDGRDVVVQVIETTARGMRVAVPQGETWVDPGIVLGLAPADEAAFAAQPPWVVVVLPFVSTDPALGPEALGAAAAAREAAAGIPNVQVADSGAILRRLSRRDSGAVTACGIDPSCAAPYAAKGGATAVLAGAVERDGDRMDLAVAGALVAAPRFHGQGSGSWALGSDPDPAAVGAAVRAAFALEPPTEPPQRAPAETALAPARRTPRTEPAGDPAASLRRSWVPLPGYPSMKLHDGRRTALCWAVSAPAVALAVGAAGASASSAGEFALVAGISSYVVVVAVNRTVSTRR